MKVVLTETVENLGEAGEVAVVKDGYARNFLIPRGWALKATEGNIRVAERRRKKVLNARQKELEAAQKLADELANASCTIKTNCGEDDKLYGSVTAADIAEAYAEQGISLDRRKIELEDPIKALGVYQVPVKLHPEVTATLKVWVVRV
ncbi:MAG: 50S ribosomal protein L9 [Candidatus Omnitrophica bacterium]|nr:50S ribosomal protein L9 [Candidatus Omnitrophota bacterium]